MSKQRLLICIDWFTPGFKAGGPIRSIENLTTNIKDKFQIFIFTSNRDLGCSVDYSGVQSDVWVDFDNNIQVYYCSSKNLKLSKLTKIFRDVEPQTIYINSMFSVWYSLMPLILAKYFLKIPKIVVAPRGMLGVGALQIKKMKKLLFIQCSKILGVYDAVVWHLTAEFEKLDVVKIYGNRIKIEVISNVSKQPSDTIKEITKVTGELKLVFVSRLSQKKNLNYLIDILMNIKDGKVYLSIAGPIEDKHYWEACEERMKKLPSNIIVDYVGELKPIEVESLIEKSHFFVLPTLNENFGHAIVDAFCAGRPVLISDQTPWNSLKDKNLGVDISLDSPNLWIEEINTLMRLNQSQFDELSHKCHSFALLLYNNKDITSRYVKLFN